MAAPLLLNFLSPSSSSSSSSSPTELVFDAITHTAYHWFVAASLAAWVTEVVSSPAAEEEEEEEEEEEDG
ncbi:MAG: hypothetical protein Q9202_004155 [Teloschistes flavicans]